MISLSAGPQDEVRRHNLARLLRLLHVDGAASRSELVALTGLNRSTVGVLVSELVEAGLAHEAAGSAGSVGRPSLVVAPVPTSAVVVAFELQVERLIGAIIGVGGEVLDRREYRHRRQGFGPQAAISQIVNMTAILLESVPVGSSWVGAGVSVPGVVDHAEGLVRIAPNLGWTDIPFGSRTTSEMTARFGAVPKVVVGNDADLGAIAEHVRGAGVGTNNLIYLSGEVGVGGGIVIDGRLMAGAGGYGGEVGHMVLNPKGELCRCGARGCWETQIGLDAILRAASVQGGSPEVLDLIRAEELGEEPAVTCLRDVREWLALGIGNLVNIFNPEVVVLGGHLKYLLPESQDSRFHRAGNSLRPSREQVRVVEPQLDGNSTLVGAGEIAFAALLADPLGVLSRSGSLVES